MQFLYKIPGYILLLFGGFCLSWEVLLLDHFKKQCLANIIFKIIFFYNCTYFIFNLLIKINTIKIIKDAGFQAVLGGFVMSFSFVAFIIAMNNTTVANVVFIISTQTMFLAIFGFFYLKEKVSLIGSSSIFLAMSGILIMVGDSISTGSLFGNISCISYSD